jgi:hypothetical protein
LPDFGRQVAQAQGAIVLLIGQRRPNKVFEVPGVSWQFDLSEGLDEVRTHRQGRQGIEVPIFPQEVLDHGFEVRRPLPQRGDLDRQNLEPVVEVCSELSLFHHCMQVPIGGRNDPDTHRDLSIFANTKHAVLLQEAQEHGLHAIVQLANLVEEEDPTFCGTDQTFPIVMRAGECASPVAEKFALRQACTDCAAVDSHEWSVASLEIKLMDRMGEQFLPGPRLTRDQDRQVAQRADSENPPEHRNHGRALSHYAQTFH